MGKQEGKEGTGFTEREKVTGREMGGAFGEEKS